MSKRKYTSKDTNLSINTIRMLGIDAIDAAKSGHPGIVLGGAAIMYALFRNHLNINPEDPFYFNRDRFVLSSGHGSALLYATMILSGCNDITIEDLKNFRQLNSKTAGHPESNLIHGIEVSTGPLGQGVAMAVGLAIAEARLNKLFNVYGRFINHHTYCYFGDGDLEEGIFYEAINVAGHLKLNKLIMLYDSNRIQLDGTVSDSTSINVKKLFKSCNWNYIKVKNANNVNRISKAIAKAKRSDKPTVIECCTHIGYGSELVDSNKCHGSPLTSDQIKKLRENLNYQMKPFIIKSQVLNDIRDVIIKRGKKHQMKFNIALQYLESKDLNLYNKYIRFSSNHFEFNIEWFKNIVISENEASRNIFGEVLQPIAKNIPTFMIGSADLASSTKAVYRKKAPFDAKNRSGQNINFGVREFAMTAICNGISAHHGCVALSSTFLAFSDYSKAAIRLAAISDLPTINVFSHDSITVGEDGPTHQPIEQLTTLRLIPNTLTFRPCNLQEIIVSFECAINSKTTPSQIITSRGNILQTPSTIEDARQGAYVIYKNKNKDHLLSIIATGSEVPIAINIAKKLNTKGIYTRVISALSLEVFQKQPRTYISTILDNLPRVSIEYGSTIFWKKYADLNIGIDTFGRSGKPNDVVDFCDLNQDKIYDKIWSWWKLNHQKNHK